MKYPPSFQVHFLETTNWFYITITQQNNEKHYNIIGFIILDCSGIRPGKIQSFLSTGYESIYREYYATV